MNLAAGETANWPLPTGRYGLHHAVIHDDIAYCAWRDACLVVVDVKDKANPKLIVHKIWAPPFGGGTHNCLPLPDRDLLIVLDETVLDNMEDGFKPIWVFDNQVKSNPISDLDLPAARRPRLRRRRRPFRPAQHPREPAGQLPELGADLRHLPERRRPGLRHPRPVPPGRGRRLRAAGAEEARRSAPQPPGRAALGRRLRRPERPLLLHRLERRRPLHHGVQGLRSSLPTAGEVDGAPPRPSAAPVPACGSALPIPVPGAHHVRLLHRHRRVRGHGPPARHRPRPRRLDPARRPAGHRLRARRRHRRADPRGRHRAACRASASSCSWSASSSSAISSRRSRPATRS